MSARDKEEMEELEITAQPKSIPSELAAPEYNSGLSVDPEDLGRHFLTDAMEQHNFESQRGGESADMWVNEAPPTDDALVGPNFETDRSIWENTVSMSMENGGAEGAQHDASPDAVLDDEQDDGMQMIDRDADGIDLTEPVIQEASLFDHETDVLGETEPPPAIITDDSKSHTKKRGGHAPKSARPAARSR
jgi:hypothetical protein